MEGNVVVLEVLKPSIMAFPPDFVPPLTWRCSEKRVLGSAPVRARTQPVLEESVWTAGTGVNAWPPAGSFRSVVPPIFSAPGAGQDVPAGGFEIPTTSGPR